jgi:RimJ/RimL family protein N-acetyltransferase
VPTLVVRPIGPDKLDLFTSFADASPLGLKPPLELYLDGLRRWYRPEWSWVALRGGPGHRRGAAGAAAARAARLRPSRELRRDQRAGSGPFGPDVAYVGVLSEHRGNGYANDLVLEASHLLAEGGATEIEAATDVGNGPMAAAFARCGYAVVDRLMVHV